MGYAGMLRTPARHLFMGTRQVQVWQHDIPALASSNVVLLHSILAVTAIHYAWREPARRELYRSRALHHHALGLPKFQEIVASASPKTAEVIVACAILLSLWMYAFPEVAAEQQSLDDILSMVEKIRGARTVSRLYRDTIVESPMGVFLEPPVLAPTLGGLGLDVSSVRQSLQFLHDQLRHESDKRAMQQLQMFLDRYVAGHDHSRLAATWMASVEDGYWARLRDHQPHAVLVFAYSTVLIRASEHECWWMSGWSERILRACSGIMSPHEAATVDWTYHEHRIRAGADELADVPPQYCGCGSENTPLLNDAKLAVETRGLAAKAYSSPRLHRSVV
ncbi:zn2 cys6 dna-binding [Trichoderma arundinaceum]|uniref:Zn2 cys6 dna-binding n=1 Tax=Trichoderma arundinaceum TaxID=490622 RepID=A0A395P2U5_TRIAR|nr:zn2 cys6 dna-binding [Trichoderma arundinaceum]